MMARLLSTFVFVVGVMIAFVLVVAIAQSCIHKGQRRHKRDIVRAPESGDPERRPIGRERAYTDRSCVDTERNVLGEYRRRHP